MYHLRLIKGRSYTGVVRATKAAPDVFVEDEDKYLAAMESGYFKEIKDAPAADTAGAPAGNEEPKQDPPAEEDISKRTIPELREYAEENGISLTGCSTKNEILQKIKEHEADVAAAAAITGQDE